MGAIGGGIWHGIKGARNSPRGERLVGSLSAIKARAPVLGGNFGVWGGLFSSYDCAVKGYRQKEDPWNAITAGFMTGGTLAFRCESYFVHRTIALFGVAARDSGRMKWKAGGCSRAKAKSGGMERRDIRTRSTLKYSRTKISIRFSNRMWYSPRCIRRYVSSMAPGPFETS
jgi:hypothetical protein